MDPKIIARYFLIAARTLTAAAAAFFIIAPSHFFQSRVLEIRPASVMFSLTGLLVLAALAYFFSKSLSRLTGVPLFPSSLPESVEDGARLPDRLLYFVSVFLILLIVGSSISGVLRLSIDADDLGTMGQMLAKGLPALDASHTEHHYLSSLMAHFSTTLFGKGRLQIALPSILFLTMFLFLITAFLFRQGAAVAALVVLVHLAANSLFLWYSHSAAGYILLTFSTYWQLTILLGAVRGAGNRPQYWQSAAAGLLICLSHGMGQLYEASFVAALILWIYYRGTEPDPKRRAYWVSLVFCQLVPCSLAFLLNLAQLGHLKELGSIGATPLESLVILYTHLPGVVTPLFGWSVLWMTRLGALFGFLIFAIRLARRSSLHELSRFCLYYLGSFTFLFTLLFFLFGSHYVFPRFLLPIVPIALTALALEIDSFQSRPFRTALLTTAIFLFGYKTMLGSTAITTEYSGGLIRREAFVKKALARQKRDSGSCLKLEGDPVLCSGYSQLYLSGREPAHCDHFLHLVFSIPDVETAIPAGWSKIDQNVDGDRLYLENPVEKSESSEE